MTEPEWPLWAAEHPAPESSCPRCGLPVAPQTAFCENCGAVIDPQAAANPAPVAAEAPANSTQTQRLGTRQSHALTCTACGGTIDADGYCSTCGTKAPSLRDHYRIAATDAVGGVCDRGIQHARNEDALAVWADGDRAVLVVCDGVSTSIDSDAAATVAADAIARVAVSALSRPEAEPATDTDFGPVLIEAATQANAAVVAGTAADSTNAASATLAAAILVGDQLSFANLGDSRVYFLTDTDGVLLSLDDSLAQAFIERGMERAEAEALPRAHAITKWLGRDSLDIVPRVGTYQVSEPGWVLVCSDGLWNYASEPATLAHVLNQNVDSDAVSTAARLVAWANAQGGRDNITVALARCPVSASATTLDPTITQVDEEHPEHG